MINNFKIKITNNKKSILIKESKKLKIIEFTYVFFNDFLLL